MVDESRPVDSSQENPDVAEENVASEVEELRIEDAIADIDVEATAASVESLIGETAAEAGSGDASGIPSPAVADLENQIVSLKAQIDDRTSQYMRIAADFENYRRRNSKEREDQEVQIKRNTITELLPVPDNFERSRPNNQPQS